MAPKDRRTPDPTHTGDEKPGDPLKDRSPASDPVPFMEPEPTRSDDTPLDKERETGR